MDTKNKTGYAIGTGRCGTLFLHHLISKEPGVASSHERNPENEAFHRYCKWHSLPVDDAGFLATKTAEILEDLEQHDFSFEASPYLSLSIPELHGRFGSRFLFVIRRPDRVVSSFVHKGFYRHPYIVSDPNLATGYQTQGRNAIHAFFARIAPRGDDFKTWNDMTQVGKVAWFWKAFNQRIVDLLAELPDDSYRMVRIEDFDYRMYIELANFLGFQASVSEPEFTVLQQSRPHAFWQKRNLDQWTTQEIGEFQSQVGKLAEQLDYEYRVDSLRESIQEEKARAERQGLVAHRKKPVRAWRLRCMSAKWLRAIANDIDVS